MWRKCDLHRHTIPDELGNFEFKPRDFLKSCVQDGLDVVAVTDHDQTDHIEAVSEEAQNFSIVVVPGVEISTDKGHVLALAPGVQGQEALVELRSRITVADSTTVPFDLLTGVLSQSRVNGKGLFRNFIVLIGAHVEEPGSILGPNQAPSVSEQVVFAQRLQALEVVHDETLRNWRRGIKGTDDKMALLRGSDAHPTANHVPRSTWIYLPEVTAECFRHAFATYESSISYKPCPPPEPTFWIKSIQFDKGPYHGRRIEFSPRTNAIIGPPSSGKSLVIDAIRYVFDLPCDIVDVRSSIEKRLERCLPDSTTIVVEVMNCNGIGELRRIRGGITPPSSEEKPIVFSQSELSRRSMEPRPSVELLDIHCPSVEVHKQQIEVISDEITSIFLQVVDLASQARDLRLEVENEQEGLEATKSAYFDLVGDEKTAKSLGDLSRLDNWHGVAGQRLEDWRRDFQVPSGPKMPSAPELETEISVCKYIPSNSIREAVASYEMAVLKAADDLVSALRQESVTRGKNMDDLRDRIQASLGGERDATQELADEAKLLRSRLSTLEQQASELAGLDKRISDYISAIDALIDKAFEAWTALRKARKAACKAVNKSMLTFFVKLNEESLTDEIDQLLNDLKTGSRLHEASVQVTRDALDRKSFIKTAICHIQFGTTDDEKELDDSSLDARKIARIAMDRSKFDGVARLAALWPSDGIEISQKPKDGDPVPFDELTEGLKALAIKEISFANSQFPAVTDQPEDAVPTTAVFENLVPTVREQRATRQFIIVSHDANVVVSGDMERVIVLPAEPSEKPIVGTLFDASIRGHAIALLEGGGRAFELRQKRYGEFG